VVVYAIRDPIDIGDKRLIERVKLCLKRQQEIIFDQ
jgi:hypothetical protein